MPEFRKQFLNYRPAQDDLAHDGLTRADNTVHETEGYKPIHLKTSFSTTGGLTSVSGVPVCKPVGPQGDVFCAWVADATLHVGINGVTMTCATSGYPPSFASAGSNQAITFLDVTEMNGMIYFVAQAQQNENPPTNTVTTIRASGYSTIGYV